MRDTSFELAQELYEISGWDGDIAWCDEQPITTANYPGYTLGYLLRKLAELCPDMSSAELMFDVAERMNQRALDFEDAAAQCCIQLLQLGALEAAS
jgi:hypothetical protein